MFHMMTKKIIEFGKSPYKKIKNKKVNKDSWSHKPPYSIIRIDGRSRDEWLGNINCSCNSLRNN